ncbi:MAG: invasion associated locus B family protein [Alphaproteobacteria bacterium]|nr:invasion associated locus B family protein [Alphaproteobacteria bacterium]
MVTTAGLAILALAAVPARGAETSQTQVFLGQFGDWYAYRLNEGGQRVCYIVSKPTRSRGKYKKRGDVVAFLTHRPKDRERDVVNFQAGYTYKRGAKVTARIGKQSFDLVTERDAAWSRDAAADKVLVAAMIKGYTLVLQGTSKSGVTTTDTYSLKGFTRARKRINRACGVK